MDSAGRIVELNARAEQLFGRPRAEVLGARPELVSPGGAFEERPESGNEGQWQAEAQDLKVEILASMGHELRTPLSAIIGFSELMFTGKVGPVSIEHKEYLGDILDSSRHLLGLINEVVALAKVDLHPEQVRAELLNVEEVIADVRKILRGLGSTQRVRTQTKVDARVGSVVLDSAKLKQIVYIFVSNALRLTPEEGTIVVRVLWEDEHRLRIEVEVDAEVDGLVRERKQPLQLDRTHRLELARRIVEVQGGSAGLRNDLGQLLTFWAVLPHDIARRGELSHSVVGGSRDE
jgi:signal transduction histidine kinase